MLYNKNVLKYVHFIEVITHNTNIYKLLLLLQI